MSAATTVDETITASNLERLLGEPPAQCELHPEGEHAAAATWRGTPPCGHSRLACDRCRATINVGVLYAGIRLICDACNGVVSAVAWRPI